MRGRAVTRAAVYVRASSEEQRRNTSPANQRRRCTAHVEANEWRLVEVYEDLGVSGAKSSRPAFDRMMTACRRGLVDVIVTTKLDRLGRSSLMLEQTWDELHRLGVTFVSLSEIIDSSTPIGRLFRTQLGGWAAFERENIKERTIQGIRDAAAAGNWPGGPAPMGLEAVPDGRHKRSSSSTRGKRTCSGRLPS